jgi:hypothetical protein
MANLLEVYNSPSEEVALYIKYPCVSYSPLSQPHLFYNMLYAANIFQNSVELMKTINNGFSLSGARIYSADPES